MRIGTRSSNGKIEIDLDLVNPAGTDPWGHVIKVNGKFKLARRDPDRVGVDINESELRDFILYNPEGLAKGLRGYRYLGYERKQARVTAIERSLAGFLITTQEKQELMWAKKARLDEEEQLGLTPAFIEKQKQTDLLYRTFPLTAPIIVIAEGVGATGKHIGNVAGRVIDGDLLGAANSHLVFLGSTTISASEIVPILPLSNNLKHAYQHVDAHLKQCDPEAHANGRLVGPATVEVLLFAVPLASKAGKAFAPAGVGNGGSALIAGGQGGNGVRLIHLTDEAGRVGIGNSGQIIGNHGIFAVPAEVASESTLVRVLRTGIPPNRTAHAIPVPDAATHLFQRPVPIGPFSAWKYLGGNYFSPPGAINTTTGAFTAGSSLIGPRLYIYGADGVIYTVVGGTLYATYK